MGKFVGGLGGDRLSGGALVVSGKQTFGLARMYQSLSEGSLGHDLKATYDIEEARVWLKKMSDKVAEARLEN